MMFGRKKTEMVAAADALPGRGESMPVPPHHEVTGNPMVGPFRDGLETAVFGMGCFWGAERMFWQAEGVYTTSVGYVGGHTPNPTYEEVCSALTGHNEVLMVVFDTAITSYAAMLKIFWEGHDPTQGMRQGNDIGTQYRSGIYTTSDEQQAEAEASRSAFQPVVSGAGYADITTEIIPLDTYYYAEHYHQQYLHKVPNGYCGLGGTGLTCPVGIASA